MNNFNNIDRMFMSKSIDAYSYSEDSNTGTTDLKFFSESTNQSLDLDVKNDNSTNSPCYCGQERSLEIVDLQCAKCLKWFHQHCLSAKVGRLVKFMTCYTFVCKNCSTNQIESFMKRSTSKFFWE